MVHIDPIRDEQGEVIGAINCFHEMTQQKRAEERLREQDQRLAVTYEHVPVGIAEIDAEGRRLRINAAGCRIAGGTREELVGGTIFGEQDRENFQSDLDQFRRMVAGELDHYMSERRYINRKGEAIWVSASCTAVRDEMAAFFTRSACSTTSRNASRSPTRLRKTSSGLRPPMSRRRSGYRKRMPKAGCCGSMKPHAG
jgi:PAS domain S-box-containing protein